MAGLSMPKVSALQRVALDATSGVHSAWTFTRGAGSWSTQTAAAVNGTTFIETGTSEDTPRFEYVASAGRRMLRMEPTRTNHWWSSDFADANADDVPDGGYIVQAGAAGTAFNVVQDSGPHGGDFLRLEDVATAARGVAQDFNGLGATLAAATQHAFSIWIRRTAGGAAAIFTLDLNPGAPTLSLDASAHDWKKYESILTTVGVGRFGFLEASGDPPGIVEMCLPQAEVGAYSTSWIPSGGADVTRAAELCAVNAAAVAQSSGFVSFLWAPGYASTTALAAAACLFEWAPNWRLDYDPADDKLKVVVNGTNRAESAALTFAAGDLYHLAVRYSGSGQTLYVNGVATSDSTAWGSPALAPYLGSRAASANCESAAYGDFLSA